MMLQTGKAFCFVYDSIEKKRPAKKQASYGTLGGTIQFRVFKGYNILNQHSG
jgi:hypothetical protein